jgi:Tol biopolymer transport system component
MFDLMTGEMTSLIQIDGEAAAYSWAPDDSHIAVAISGSNNFANGIWIFDILDGTNDFLSTGEAAVWSADGSQIAVFSCEQASNGISTRAFVRLIAFSRDKKQEVLFEDDNCLKLAYMTWSADNKSIAFSYSINTTSNKHLDKIILIDMASKEANAILADGSWSPSFSPTGEKLVYINNYALAISDKDGTCVENKDIGFGSIGDVVWSPDGSQWAVSTLGDIYIVETSKYMNQDPLGNSSSCP